MSGYRFRRPAPVDVAELLEGLGLRESQRFQVADNGDMHAVDVNLSREELLQLGFRPVKGNGVQISIGE